VKSQAQRREEVAAYWLMRSEQPDWSAAAQHDLDAWLEADVRNKIAFWRLEFGWRRADRLAALRSPVVVPRRVGWHFPRLGRREIGFLASAAALAACFLLATSTDFWKRKSYETGVGSHETVSLSDGSIVELNTATFLRAEVNDKMREVWLDRGEAFFEVVHDAAHPFIVRAGSRTITVLGTKFSVRREADRVDVAVIEGRVQVDETVKRASPPVVVVKGDMVLSKGASELVERNASERISAALEWRHGLLNFEQETLAHIAEEFNRYNRKQLVIADPGVAQMRIGGSFETTKVEAFVHLLSEAYGLRVADDGREIRISK
jgi:transmembrane sensor